MGQNVTPTLLNIGCGKNTLPPPWINVDAYGDPDVKHDLNIIPWHFAEDQSVDQIAAWHIFEHLEQWWDAFKECARILKPGGTLEIRVPDESSASALTYRDHLHVFSPLSFNDLVGTRSGTNAWAAEQKRLPLKMVGYQQVPFKEYQWMFHFPWLLRFCSRHMRNFIWEQRFIFQKTRSNA